VIAGPDFSEVYAAEYGRFVGQLFVLTGDLGEAQDVVQEAFARALGRWRTVGMLDDPAAWVRRVAINLAVSRWRRHRNSLAAWRRHGEPAAYDGPGVDRVALVTALRTLPSRQRTAAVLYYVADLPVAAVAAELGVPEGTVKSDLARARGVLATLLGNGEEAGVR
jgi:RNA polymerase sigma-70 factor (ECF subfamily)